MTPARSGSLVSTHSRPKAAGPYSAIRALIQVVSTHSRPKAAGANTGTRRAAGRRFNTQPPEGGWEIAFGSTKARVVSTHSRPKAAGVHADVRFKTGAVSTHSRPKAAGETLAAGAKLVVVSTHSRPKAAGRIRRISSIRPPVSTHSRPKAAGFPCRRPVPFRRGFNTQPPEGGWSLPQKPCSIRFRSSDFAKLPRKARTRV